MKTYRNFNVNPLHKQIAFRATALLSMLKIIQYVWPLVGNNSLNVFINRGWFRTKSRLLPKPMFP